MRSSTALVSLALLAASAPALAAPLAVSSQFEARGGGAGAVGEIAEEGIKTLLGKNVVNGIGSALGATAIGELFNKLVNRDLSDDDAEILAQLLSARELDVETRSFLSSGLEKLIGVGEQKLSSVFKDAIIGGSVAGATSHALTPDNNSRRSLEARGGGAGAVGEIAEEGIKTLLGKNVVNGIGSALGATAIGELFNKLVNRDLSDDDAEILAQLLSARDLDIETRSFLSSGLEKLIGVGEQKLSSVIKDAIIGGSVAGATSHALTPDNNSRRSLEARGGGAGAVGEIAEEGIKTLLGKNVVNGIGSALGATAIGALFNKLVNRDLSDDDAAILAQLLSARDLETRSFLSSGLEKLIGVGEQKLSSVFKDAIIGGSVAGATSHALTPDQSQSRRDFISTGLSQAITEGKFDQVLDALHKAGDGNIEAAVKQVKGRSLDNLD